MRVQAKIQKWGNSLGLRLSGPLKTVPHFEEDMLVEIEATEQGLTIRPLKKKRKRLPFSEANLLKGLNEDSSHADELASLTNRELDH